MVGTFSPSAHFIRSAAEIFHGFGVALHAAEGCLKLLWEGILIQHQCPADIQDVAHRLIAHRADIHTGAAGGAGPDCFFGYGKLDQCLGAGFAPGDASPF